MKKKVLKLTLKKRGTTSSCLVSSKKNTAKSMSIG